MNTITIQSAKQFKSFLNENRKNITEINGVLFGEVYPMLEATNRYVTYYDIDAQTSKHLSAPFSVKTK
jgi:hypothetical protein